jgi:C_GCAxxG_C_C family probable redox protein
MNKVERSEAALAYFREGSGFNCAQSVAASFAPQSGLEREALLKAAAAFGGGIGRSGGICGALGGAMIVVGLRCGMTDIEDQDSKKETYRKAQAVLARFKEKHGTLQCRELLGHDVGTEEGLQQIRDAKMGATHCTGYIRDAVKILEELL